MTKKGFRLYMVKNLKYCISQQTDVHSAKSDIKAVKPAIPNADLFSFYDNYKYRLTHSGHF